MRGKREFIAKVSAATGATRLLEAMQKQPVLMILNYHRVGNADETPYDSGTFSCTAEEFDWQIQYLKRHYRMVTLEQLLENLTNGVELSGPAVLITLDDGYIDNYRIAFPVLQRHAVPAVFFLPTAFVGTGRLPWWDVIAYIVKHSRKTKIHLTYPENKSFNLFRDDLDWSIMHILNLYAQTSMRDSSLFIDELETACESSRPLANAERCFLSWDEARQMQQDGMMFGSHTHTHEILSKISTECQRQEVSLSRKILQHELRRNIDTLAYPVGASHTFSDETIKILREAGYRAAFSFYGGFNKPGVVQPFDIRRFGIDGQSQPRFRLQTALGTFTGSRWI
jgi:peptidoglycan/xylan/chitin deacetylase (PgdA/CDA1 family)